MEPQSSLGDRAVVIAGVLAILLVGLFGAEPDQQPAPLTRTVQSAQR
jgi:hypothetical protein